MLEFSHRAMACDFVVLAAERWTTPTDDGSPAAAAAAEAILQALESVDEMEAKLSIYRDDSEISEVNRNAYASPVEVSRETFDVLLTAKRVSELTDGAMDITAGPLVEVWGFHNRQGRRPSEAAIAGARQKVGMHLLELNPQRRSVTFRAPGMRLNLGAIGKGFAIDFIAARLTRAGVEHFLIHAGFSSVLARGDQSAKSFHGESDEPWGWRVGIAHPTKPGRRVAGVWLRDAALSTSGSGQQFFHHQGKRYGHVIDPRSGQPAGDLLSLSVVTPSAAIADAAATGLFVLGRDRAEALCKPQQWPVMMIAAGKRQDEIELRSGGIWNWCEEWV